MVEVLVGRPLALLAGAVLAGLALAGPARAQVVAPQGGAAEISAHELQRLATAGPGPEIFVDGGRGPGLGVRLLSREDVARNLRLAYGAGALVEPPPAACLAGLGVQGVHNEAASYDAETRAYGRAVAWIMRPGLPECAGFIGLVPSEMQFYRLADGDWFAPALGARLVGR